MSGSFWGINIALRGLYTSQKNLDVIAHNINNASTPGYSRQVAVQTASQPVMAYDGTGMIGTGSDVVAIERVRDEYLDYKYWSESLEYGEWSVKNTSLSDIEVAFNEISDSGFRKTFDEFFSALQELSKDAGNMGVRALVKERGAVIANQLRSVAGKFERLQEDANRNIRVKVNQINSIAEQIKKLNDQIYRAELEGNIANDLRDQRSVLIDKLSRIVNIEATEVIAGKLPNGNENKKLVLSIAGKVLVDYHGVNKIVTVVREDGQKLNINEDIDGLYDIQWEDGSEFLLRGGELRGYIDIRDGNEGIDEGNGVSPVFKGVPYYIRKLNDFARRFAEVFNEGYDDGQQKSGHVDGYDLYGNAGLRFFTINGENPEGDLPVDYYDRITAKNIGVNIEIVNDTGKIAAASIAGQNGNGENIRSIAEIRHFNGMYAEGAPEDYIKAIIVTMGIDSQQAKRISDSQVGLVDQIQGRRDSISGVSINEEMANMVKYQHAYNAAAKVISVMAQLYEVLISKVGNL